MAISAVLSPRLAWFSFLERFWDLFAMEKTLSKHISVQRFLVRPLLGSSFTLQGVGQLSVYDMEAMKRNQWLQTFWLCSRVFLFFYFFIIIFFITKAKLDDSQDPAFPDWWWYNGENIIKTYQHAAVSCQAFVRRFQFHTLGSWTALSVWWRQWKEISDCKRSILRGKNIYNITKAKLGDSRDPAFPYWWWYNVFTHVCVHTLSRLLIPPPSTPHPFLMMMMMMKCCLMSPDVSWHIRDKLWPMPKHGSI